MRDTAIARCDQHLQTRKASPYSLARRVVLLLPSWGTRVPTGTAACSGVVLQRRTVMVCKSCRGAFRFIGGAFAYGVAAAVLVGLAGGGGCAKPKVVPATTHQATLPAQVKLYHK